MIHPPSIVQVAFPTPGLDELSYHVMDREVPEVGMRVLAPLGKQHRVGLVIGKQKQVSFETKALTEILDDEPLFTPVLVKLMHDMSRFYAVSLGEVLQLVLLKGFDQKSKKKILCLDQIGKPMTPVEQTLFDELAAKKKALDFQYFKKNRKTDLPILKALQKKGWVHIGFESQRKKNMIKEVALYALKHMPEKGLGPKQKKILNLLKNNKSWTLIDDIEKHIDRPQASLKTLVQKGAVELKKEMAATTQSSLKEKTHAITLNADQVSVLAKIQKHLDQGHAKDILLHGVTGSGKTEIYMQAAQHALDQGKTVLALVPEIALTHQFVHRFISRFGSKVALMHSQRTGLDRQTEWMRIRQGQAQVVIGTRSAVFVPLENLGLIIIDECHDGSFKQSSGVLYHGEDVARMRQRIHPCVILKGSATPMINDFFKAETVMSLPTRATQQALPLVRTLDMKKEKGFGKSFWIGETLKEAIRDTLSSGQQALLFLNRRGYSHVVFCYRCGSQVHCPHCAVTLTFHKHIGLARCHYCLYEHRMDALCPSCGKGELIHFGLGTEKIEEEIKFNFPDARVARLDRDQTTKKHLFAQTMNQMHQGKIDILLGTQMIAKGLDFPNVTLVGILLADQSLHMPSYLAPENTFQLVTQVVGRSGRGHVQGRALIQTLKPDHYAIKAGAMQDYPSFYQSELTFRKAMGFPPFSHMVLFEGVGQQCQGLEEMMGWLGTQVKKNKAFDLLGPAPAPISKIKDDYRFHLLVKHDKEDDLHSFAQWLYPQARQWFSKKKFKLKMDIHPLDFL